MTVYNPDQTAGWTQTDWDALAGKTITIATGNSLLDRERTVGQAALRPGPYGPDAVVAIVWADCGSTTFVREAGAAPIRRGDPGYAPHLDRDGDGVGCAGD